MKQKKAILRRKEPVFFNGRKWEFQVIDSQVTVLSVAGIYAMVRYPGAMPFVALVKNLQYI